MNIKFVRKDNSQVFFDSVVPTAYYEGLIEAYSSQKEPTLDGKVMSLPNEYDWEVIIYKDRPYLVALFKDKKETKK